ncbi:hypothetical protein KBC55_00650 [Patescibacteria group bacterium]|nr:hypothetical protein [Patescibacteria group bacterium]
MTLTTHAAIGIAIGSVIGQPALGFALGAASHFLVDMIPHGDNYLADGYKSKQKTKMALAYVSTDAALAILVLLAVFATRPEGGTPNIAFAATVAGSVLPDLIVGLSELVSKEYRFFRAFNKVHFFFHDFFSRRYGDVRLSYALIAQAGFIAILLNFVY